MSYEEINAKYRGDGSDTDGHVVDKRGLDDDDDEVELDRDFDEKNLSEIKIILLILIACLFVTNYLTYRAHIVTLQAFKSIKMQNIQVEGF